MSTIRRISRIADFLVGIPLILFGVNLIGVDVAMFHAYLTNTNKHLIVASTFPVGTIVGLGFLLFGCRVVFRRRRVIPPTENPVAKRGIKITAFGLLVGLVIVPFVIVPLLVSIGMGLLQIASDSLGGAIVASFLGLAGGAGIIFGTTRWLNRRSVNPTGRESKRPA